jgi:hypothetical protein
MPGTRGGGWAKDVTPEGRKLMSERLDIAEQTLTRAWEKDKTNSEAATLMLKVELGQGKGRDRMELWFKRAVEANPDNLEACGAKMYYLQPKWHGTPQDMLAFGHECFETHNWHGQLPFKQVDAIEDLRAYANDEQAYLTTPAVWRALAAVYEPFLRNDPRASYLRSGYCNYACLTGHWDVARAQFAILGSSAVASRFGGAEAMEKMRAIAEQKGLRPNVP